MDSLVSCWPVSYTHLTMTEETTAPEPEPTIEPGEGFSEEGNLVTRDLLYDCLLYTSRCV